LQKRGALNIIRACHYCHDVTDGNGLALDPETNVLFGVLAVQLRFVDAARLTHTTQLWRADPSIDLPQRLIESGDISPADSELVHAIVDTVVRSHGGNAAKALESLEVDGVVGATLPPAREPVHAAVTAAVNSDSDVSAPVHIIKSLEEVPGRYTSIAEHARGGMGRILLVHDEFLGRNVALKELMGRRGSTDASAAAARISVGATARFLQEARITGTLEHPSIVPVYELGRRADGTLYYTMKLVRGDTLAQALGRARSLDARLRLLNHFVDLCHAIAYAHSRGVIHRDIKPGNVMIGEFGETIVLDWGLAKSKRAEDVLAPDITQAIAAFKDTANADALKTSYGHAIGTPAYMPPEQARGELDIVDERSDVYALGAILYELLTGRLPFSGSVAQVLSDVAEKSPPPVQVIESKAPAELAAICARAMSRERTSRYPSAKEFAEDVERFVAGAFVEAYSYTYPQRVARWVRRYKAPLATAAAAALVLLCVSIYYVINLSQKNADLVLARANETQRRIEAEQARDAEAVAKKRAQTEAYLAQIRNVDNLIRDRNYDAARIELFQTDPAQRNWEWGFALNTISQALYTIRDSPFAAVSPDGKILATMTKDGTVSLWNAPDGSLVQTFKWTSGRATCFAWGPDNSTMAVGTLNQKIHIGAAEKGTLTRTIEECPRSVYSLLFAGDRRRLISGSGDGTIQLWNIETDGGPETLETGFDTEPKVRLSPDGNVLFTAMGNQMQLWNASTRQRIIALGGKALDVSADGKRFILIDGANCVFYDARSGDRLSSFASPNSRPNCVAISSDGGKAAVGNQNGNVTVHETATGAELNSFQLGEEVFSVLFSPDDRFVAGTSPNGLARIWRLEDHMEISTFRTDGPGVRLAFSPTGDRVYKSSIVGIVEAKSVAASVDQRVLTRHSKTVRAIASSGNAPVLATISDDKTVNIIDLKTGRERAKLGTFFSFPIGKSVAIDSDGGQIVSGLDDFTPVALDFESGRVTPHFSENIGLVRSLVFRPSSTLALLGSEDGTVREWDSDSGAETRILARRDSPIHCLDISASGTTLAIGEKNGCITLIDLSSAGIVQTFEPDQNAIRRVRFAHDDRRIIIEYESASMKIWDISGGGDNSVYQVINSTPTGSTSLSNGERIVLGLRSSLAIADGQNGESMFTFDGHIGPITDVQCSRDGKRLYSAGGDGTVRQWSAAPWRTVGEDADDQSAVEAELVAWQMRERAALQALTIDHGVTPFWIVTTREVLRDCFSRFAAELRSRSTRSDGTSGLSAGIVVTPGEVSNSVARICLLQGDCLVQMNGSPIETEQQLAESLEGFLNGPETTAAPVLGMSRLGHRYDVQFQILPRHHSRREVQINTEIVLAAIAAEASLIESNRVQLLQINRDRAASMGEAIDESEDAISGLWLSHTGVPQCDQYVKTLRLEAGDRLVSIDDEPIGSLRGYLNSQHELAQRLASGGADYTLGVERGEFQSIEIRIHVR
jgi:WD40 repeat protein/serine/threonine protein kinase